MKENLQAVENYVGTMEIQGINTCDTIRDYSRRMLKKAVQQGRSE
jgi:hypothetical protein